MQLVARWLLATGGQGLRRGSEHGLFDRSQRAGVLAVESLGLADSGKLVYFMAIEGAKFRQPVEPGVLLKLDVEFVQKRATVCKFAGRASVDGKLAAEASFTAMIADPPAA